MPVRLIGSALIALLGIVGTALAQEEHSPSGDHAVSSDSFHFTTQRAWYFRSFLPNVDDDANTLGFEVNSAWGWGNYNVINIAYIELADYPLAIPGYPPGNPEPEGTVPATGINDLLTAFLFSKKGAHHGPHHFEWGFTAQLPTGDSDTLSSGKYSLGPAVEYEYQNGRFFAEFFALQLWSVAGDSDRKDVSMMMIKPMITYDLNEKWKAVYMPYGVSIYWNKPSGQRVYLPLGGGIQRQFSIGKVPSAVSLQLFRNVLRPDDGVEHDLRFMFEINF